MLQLKMTVVLQGVALVIQLAGLLGHKDGPTRMLILGFSFCVVYEPQAGVNGRRIVDGLATGREPIATSLVHCHILNAEAKAAGMDIHFQRLVDQHHTHELAGACPRLMRERRLT